VTWHQSKVALDCHIQVSCTLYSVPYQYVGKTVDVKLGTETVEIYFDSNLVKTLYKGARGRRVTDWNDYPPEKAAFFQRTPEWYRQKAGAIGPAARKKNTGKLSLAELHLVAAPHEASYHFILGF
jgi:hypothetical protein